MQLFLLWVCCDSFVARWGSLCLILPTLLQLCVKLFCLNKGTPPNKVLFAVVPCRASIRCDSLMCSYHFHVTSVLEAPFPFLALIICFYGQLGRLSSGRWRRWGLPDCSSSPTVAGLLCFVPAFLAAFLPIFSVRFARTYVSLVFLLCTVQLASRLSNCRLRGVKRAMGTKMLLLGKLFLSQTPDPRWH